MSRCGDARVHGAARGIVGLVTEGEAFVRAFHATFSGITARAFARGGSYDRLAALVPRDARLLDVACGDGALLRRLGPGAVGIDASREEVRASLVGGVRAVVQGRAQALPFPTGAFDVVTCHLAFMLLDDLDQVVAELARVLVPGGSFLAVLGGGPVARDGGAPGDAFDHFLEILGREPRGVPRLGDPRARTEAGWRALFADWTVDDFVRWELDLGGRFDEVWGFLGASYELPAARAGAIRDELRGRLRPAADGRIPCRVVTWLARARRPG